MNMDRSSSDFQLFVSNLYEANDFEQAFNVFESQVLKLGFDGVLYTYIADSAEVINTAKDYGINNGVTLPLLSGQSGIAGASIISEETKAFSKLLDSRIEILTLCTRLFHNMVLSNAPYKAEFSKTTNGAFQRPITCSDC